MWEQAIVFLVVAGAAAGLSWSGWTKARRRRGASNRCGDCSCPLSRPNGGCAASARGSAARP
ncbi:MAG: hypothetical protein KA248_02195 [Kiritimatiellae bacterium]|nr:hypothetical protein [Kiritimatiellia bacterium]